MKRPGRNQRIEHSKDLESEVTRLRAQLETERRDQLIFLNSLRREVFELEPLDENMAPASLAGYRDDCVRFLQKYVRVAEGKRDHPKDQVSDQKYLQLR